MSENNDDRPRRPSSYARCSIPELLRKVESHRQMIASIERELARRGVGVPQEV
jgi:hypothetical protein